MKTLLTMADMAARRGTDKEIGLVQQIINYSPEITSVMGRTVPGTFATAKVQIGIPKGGAFRAVNQGVKTSAGSYEKRRSHQWTDTLSSKLHALLPMGITPTHCFATKRAIAGLQQSRTVTLFGEASIRPNQPTIAPIPAVDVMGVPIMATDGIQLGAAF